MYYCAAQLNINRLGSSARTAAAAGVSCAQAHATHRGRHPHTPEGQEPRVRVDATAHRRNARRALSGAGSSRGPSNGSACISLMRLKAERRAVLAVLAPIQSGDCIAAQHMHPAVASWHGFCRHCTLYVCHSHVRSVRSHMRTPRSHMRTAVLT